MLCTSLVISDMCYLVEPSPHPTGNFRGYLCWRLRETKSWEVKWVARCHLVSVRAEGNPSLVTPRCPIFGNVTCFRLWERALLQSTWFQSLDCAKQGPCEQISPSPKTSDSSHVKGTIKYLLQILVRIIQNERKPESLSFLVPKHGRSTNNISSGCVPCPSLCLALTTIFLLPTPMLVLSRFINDHS